MSNPSNRRDFVRAVAVSTGACLAASTSTARADDPKKEDKPKPKDEPSVQKTPASPTEVDARMQLVLARFGKHLDEDGRKSVRAEIESLVKRAETLRKFPLDNGDGPFPVFTPFRGAPA